MSGEQLIELSLEQVEDYEFRVRFDGTAIPALTTDEAAPLGRDAGPNPARMLAASVANCLCASLLFALRKFKDEPGRLSAKVAAHLTRNEHGRLRITRVAVDLQLADAAAALPHVERALAQFEDFCIVTESVRQGIAVDVQVRDASGAVVHASAA
ncbi:OsmC family protein [Dyella acidiphila]|uniref:OsmC family protein n=1 Tax=Dyella acidiphila TaxID=2775866 RepID=A0ABR9G4N6_9GAMM|nr:OsmC family protein [Dyella acidiphila]MBE1159018.1 OsmC family protein [Dyella acidiphila]